MASLSLRSRILAVPRNLKVIEGIASPSFAPATVRPWLRQTCDPLRASFQVWIALCVGDRMVNSSIELRYRVLVQLAAVPRPMLTGGRGRFSVFSQAVATTPEIQAAAESISEISIPEAPEDAPQATTKTKKLTKRVKHIMEVMSSTS